MSQLSPEAQRLLDSILARSRAAAGEAPSPAAPEPDKLGPLAGLLTAPEGTPPCSEEGCPDPAYVELLAASGSAGEGEPLCGRHARRRWLSTPSLILPLTREDRP